MNITQNQQQIKTSAKMWQNMLTLRMHKQEEQVSYSPPESETMPKRESFPMPRKPMLEPVVVFSRETIQERQTEEAKLKKITTELAFM